jgi:predicted GTPase
MYVTQVATAPPRLVIFANFERDIPAHYLRFLETRFRSALGLVGTPLRLELRRAEGRGDRAPGGAHGRARSGRMRSRR